MSVLRTPRALSKPTSRFLGGGEIEVSFEFFPPKTVAMEQMLWRSIRRLEPLNPSKVSVTYGAGGSTRDRTHSTVARILRETSLRPAAHLTCVSATREEIDYIIRKYWTLGIQHIVALRGDPPGGPSQPYQATAGGYVNATALVAGIKEIAPFEITVACYPEKHPESRSFHNDIDILKAKIDAGATSAISQFFFDNEVFFRFVDRARKSGIQIPIVPGIVPIYDFHRTASFASKAGVRMPYRLARRLGDLDEEKETRRLAAAAATSEQVLELVRNGITCFHFYTLNRADLVFAICHLLGLRPTNSLRAIDV